MKFFKSYGNFILESKKLEEWFPILPWVLELDQYYDGIDGYAKQIAKIWGHDVKDILRNADDTSNADELGLIDEIIDDNYKVIKKGKYKDEDGEIKKWEIRLVNNIEILTMCDEIDTGMDAYYIVDPKCDAYWESYINKHLMIVQKMYPYLSQKLQKKYEKLTPDHGFFVESDGYLNEDIMWVHDVLTGLSVATVLFFLRTMIVHMFKSQTGSARRTKKFIILSLALRQIKIFANNPDIVEIRRISDSEGDRLVIKPTNVEKPLIVNFTKKTMYFTQAKEDDVFELNDKDIIKLKKFLKI